jgi:beta-N-acetylhexosaminidase
MNSCKYKSQRHLRRTSVATSPDYRSNVQKLIQKLSYSTSLCAVALGTIALAVVSMAGLTGCDAGPVAATHPPPGDPAPTTPAPTTPLPPLPRPDELLVLGLLLRMDEAELLGQMLFMSLEQHDDGSAVQSLDSKGSALLSELRPGGLVLFAGNFQSVEQTTGFVNAVQRASRLPMLVAVDHEGGNVSRLTASDEMNGTMMPSATLTGYAAEGLFEAGDPDAARDLARRWARVIGEELAALGVHMNFAPVADLALPGSLIASQRRTFGSDPRFVGEMVAASVAGLHDAGVTAVIKHFPGQGAAVTDSHDGLVVLQREWDLVRGEDLVPFVAGLNSGARAVMTAHVAFPALTGTNESATESSVLLGDLLRDELEFSGLVVTDALNMDAVSAVDAATASIRAGADIMLTPPDPAEFLSALVSWANSGMVSRERLEVSVRRILEEKLRAGLFGPAPVWTDPDAADVIGSAAHWDLVDEIRTIARSRRD